MKHLIMAASLMCIGCTTTEPVPTQTVPASPVSAPSVPEAGAEGEGEFESEFESEAEAEAEGEMEVEIELLDARILLEAQCGVMKPGAKQVWVCYTIDKQQPVFINPETLQ